MIMRVALLFTWIAMDVSWAYLQVQPLSRPAFHSLTQQSMQVHESNQDESGANDKMKESPFSALKQQIASVALTATLCLTPLAVTTTTLPEPVLAATAAAPTPTTTSVAATATDSAPKTAKAKSKVEKQNSAPEPAEKKIVEAAKAAYKAQGARVISLEKELEGVKGELSTYAKTVAKKQGVVKTFAATLDAETQKLNKLKTSGDKNVILAQKAKVVSAKNALSDVNGILQASKKQEAAIQAKFDSLRSTIKDTEKARDQAKAEIPKLEKKYQNYLKKVKKQAEQSKKKLAQAMKKQKEIDSKKAAVARKKVAEQRKKTEQERQRQAAEAQKRKEAELEKVAKNRQMKIQAEKDAKIKAEKDAKDAKIKAEKDAKEAKVKAEKDAKEAKIKAEAEAKKAQADAKKAAEDKAKKVVALKAKIQKLRDQKGDLIVKGAADNKVSAIEAKIAAAQTEINSLQPSSKK